MSLFLCSTTSPLLRSGVRGLSARAARSIVSSPSQWLTGGAPTGQRLTPFSYRSFGLLSRPRASAYRHSHGHIYRRTFFSPRIVRNYEELPQEYRDQDGLQFSAKDMSPEEARKIFGPKMTQAGANRLLRVLHGRRVAGTLYDPAFAVHTASYSDSEIERALEYLRRTVPVEETMNAGLRAEDELAQMEEDMAREKKEQENPDDEVLVEEDRVIKRPDPVYGHSRLDEIRERNIAKRKAEEKVLEQKRKAKEELEGAQAGPVARIIDDRGRQITNAKVAKYYEGAQSDLAEPPIMSNWERIMPSATVVLLTIGVLAAFAMVYQEPAPRYRLIREVSTAQATVGALIAMNVLVWAAWKIPPLWKMLNRQFILVVATVKPTTLFTTLFSHQKLSHMVVNMIPLWFVGTSLHNDLGRGDFIALYLACGGMGYLGSLVAYTLAQQLWVATLGSSGAVLGICTAYFWEHRWDGFRFFGQPSEGVHGVVFLIGLAALQLAALPMWRKTDIVAHVAGMLTGVIGIEMIGRARRKDENRGKLVMDAIPGVGERLQAGNREQEALMKRVEVKGKTGPSEV